MIRILFKTAIRNIRKDTYQSFLNIIGLALGFAAFLFIATYFFHEYSFDRFHSKSDQLYRAVTKVKMGDTKDNLSTSEVALGYAAKNNLPEVLDATRLYFDNNVIVKVDQNQYQEKRFWYADDNIFDLFDFDLQKGDKQQALKKPFTIVITPEFSKKYFGDSDPIGKTVEIKDNGQLYEVTGLLKEIPSTSHIQFTMLASFSSLEFAANNGMDEWGNFRDLFTYILLDKHANHETMNQKLQDLTVQYYIPMMEKVGIPYEEFTKGGNYVIHSLQPLKNIHLGTTFTNEAILHGNKQLLYALALIGLMIIVIACFNFINLSTARASLRAKEIGVKKIIGSGRGQIIGQILFETFLLCIIGLAMAITILFISIALIDTYTGIDMQFSQIFQGFGIVIMLIVFLMVIALAGIFPSFVIARFNPLEIVKGSKFNWNIHPGFRSVLVSFQFIIFIVLICGTIVVKKQMYLLHHQNPGFHKENVLVVKNTQKLRNNMNSFKEEISKIPGVIKAAYSTSLPSMFNGSSNPFGKTDKKNQLFLYRVEGDEDFLSTLNIKLLDGRDFTGDANRENLNAIINKKAADNFGWDNCTNKIIYDYNNGGIEFNVIGIVEDFHLESMREQIEPMILRYSEFGNYLSIRVQPEDVSNVIDAAQQTWTDLNSGSTFEYSFLDQSFDNQYKQEVRFGKLISLFSILSICIACLGLLGLVSFTLMRKQKEIGIRKVNGARINEVLGLLNKDFIKWISVAFVLATPISWFAMNKWLENFAYKTDLSWWIFAIGGMSALCIALLTVSFQSWRAASRNPVEALRYE